MATKKDLKKALKKTGMYKEKELKNLKKKELERLVNGARFGNYMAPVVISPGNNQINMNNPFSDIYAYDNLSGYPWYKNQVPTLALRNGFGNSGLRSFNYTIQQYADNASTPNLNQLHKIAGEAAYSFPMGGVSGKYNLTHYVPKSNHAGMGF